MLLSHLGDFCTLLCGFEVRIPRAGTIVDRHHLAKEIISLGCLAIQMLAIPIAESNDSIEYWLHFDCNKVMTKVCGTKD